MAQVIGKRRIGINIKAFYISAQVIYYIAYSYFKQFLFGGKVVVKFAL